MLDKGLVRQGTVRDVLRRCMTGTAGLVLAVLVASSSSVAEADPVAAGDQAGSASSAAMSTGLQDETSTSVSWSGKRSTQRVPDAYDGSLVTLSGKASVTFAFRGAGVEWLARTGPFDGKADVYLDGRRTSGVDLYTSAKRYQQPVFTVRGLQEGKHTLRVVRAGTKDPRSTGRNVTVDAFRVLDAKPPARPLPPSVEDHGSGARITWTRGSESDLAGYRLVRRAATGDSVVVGTTGAGGSTLDDVGLAVGVYTYSLQAVDTSGNASSRSAGVVFTRAAPALPDLPRYATCPDPTVEVGDTAALRAALDAAAPGTVIRLRPGRYQGQTNITVRGTAKAPVWVCGPRTAVFDGGGPARSGGLRIAGSAHLVVAGVSVRNSQKGVSVLDSSSVVLADLAVTDIGDEAIHLKLGTVDSAVVGNTLSRTGLVSPEYGEGVYVGTDHNNLCATNACAVDRSDRNRIEQNVISQTAAEPIEVKEGTVDGVVSGNQLDGAGSTVGRLIALKGSDWTVSGNVGTDGGGDGVQVLQRLGFGTGNAVFDNTFTGRLTGYGVRLPVGDPTNVVGCDTRVPRGAKAVSNVVCQP